MKHFSCLVALLLPASFLIVELSHAQRPEGNLALEEVIVTATRREENLQEVPMSVTAFSGEFFQDAGITDFSEIDAYTPSLKITPGTSSSATSIRIRGIGSVGTNTGIDPSVGFFIDGVYQGRAGMSISDLFDIERVEILRGPQGTLYGKNTAAGAISIITRKPSSEFEGQVEATYNSQERLELRGVINIPFGDSGHASRLTAFGVDGDHLYENSYENGAQDKFNDASKWGVRSRTLFDFGDSGEFLLTLDYTKEDTDCCVFAISNYDGLSTVNAPITNNPSADWAVEYAPSFRYDAFEDAEPQGPPPQADPFGDDYWVGGETYNKLDVGGVAVEWNRDLANEHTLTFINAWRHYESNSAYDGDFTAYDAVLGTSDVELDQYSSELRIASPGGETFDYQFGLYAYYSDLESVGTFTLLPPLLERVPPLSIFYPEHAINIDSNDFTTTSFAAFGQVTWNLSEQWSTTLGVRWTNEQKDRDSSQVTQGFVSGIDCDYIVDVPPIAGPCVDLDQTRSDTDLSPSLTLRYFLMEDVMLYGSISQGFKSGGFDQRRVLEGQTGEFDEETATNYELGWKGTWFDRRLQVNGTFYFVDYDDFQSQAFDGSSIKVTNAGSMESYGMELESQFVATENITLGTAIGYNKAEYKDFKNGQCTVEYGAREYYDNGGNIYPAGAMPPCTVDLGGEEVDNTPEWTFSSFAQYVKPLGENLKTVTRLEHNYTDSYYLDQDLDENLKNDDVHLVNLRFTLSDSDATWEAAVWGRNLLDEESYAIGIDVPLLSGFAGIVAQERTYGMTLRYFWH